MSIYPNVTKEDLINLSKLADQQKEQKASKIKTRILKQTHDEKLAETFKPITNKLEKVITATEKIDPTFITFQNQLPEGVTVSDSLIQSFAFMNKSKNFFKTIRNTEGKLTWNGVIIKPLGDNRVKIGNDEYNLTPEIQKALTQTNYNFKNMNDDDI